MHRESGHDSTSLQSQFLGMKRSRGSKPSLRVKREEGFKTILSQPGLCEIVSKASKKNCFLSPKFYSTKGLTTVLLGSSL